MNDVISISAIFLDTDKFFFKRRNVGLIYNNCSLDANTLPVAFGLSPYIEICMLHAAIGQM